MSARRVLVTGAGGFVGRHLCAALRADPAVELLATSKRATDADYPLTPLDVCDEKEAANVIAAFRPTHVVHLAGLAAPVMGDADPDLVWRLNLHGSLAIARAVRSCCPEAWLLWIGSGLVYGATGQNGQALHEGSLLAPTNIYAATKAAADLALGAMTATGLKVVRVRPFNHTGPGQTEDFVVPGFAAQIARIERGDQPPDIKVGNLEAERDFLDVGDVADAYVAILNACERLEAGSIFNICSGQSRRISNILDALVAKSNVRITIAQDPARLRPSETPCYVGDARRLISVTGWQPRISFDDTLQRVLDDWRQREGGNPPRP